MSNQMVMPCPSCGASMSVDPGASSVQCQFCGTTSAVPAELRASGRAAAGASNPLYQPLPYSDPAPAGNVGASVTGLDPTQTKAIGDAVRGGNLAEAARLYQSMFGASSADAQTAVAMLAAGQAVQVGTAGGLPQYIQVSTVAPATPYVVPVLPDMSAMAPMMPAIPDSRRIWRGVMGFNLAITVVILLFTACIVLAAMIPFAFFAFPGIGHLFGR
jgi:LSD1 subclass zinc finger protein